MMKYNINEILQNIKIPEPDELVKKAAIKAAVDAFNKQKLLNMEGHNENHIGVWSSFFMRFTSRRIAVASGIGGLLVILIIGLAFYTFDNKELQEKFAQDKIKSRDMEVTQNDFNIKRKKIGGNMASKSSLNKTKSPEAKSSPDNFEDFISGYSFRDISETTKRKITGTFEHKPQEYYDTRNEQFEPLTPNSIKLVTQEPVSTFSIDVDTDSYAFVRRQLNSGRLPPMNSVRLEEMINYFDYDYSLPENKEKPFKPTLGIYPSPWNKNTKLLHIGIKGFDIVPDKRPRANLVFLIDVSGSMKSEDKLPLLKNSLRLLVNSLKDEDTVAIVVYSEFADTALNPTKIKEKEKILEAIDKMTNGRSTNSSAGIQRAYALAKANFNKNGVNRVILVTDGDFNVGIKDPEKLKDFVDKERNTGIYLSVLGFGQGRYNNTLMQKLAQNGNGNAFYIDNLNEAKKVLMDEAASTLFTIAKDVKIQVEFNHGLITEYRLIGYESRKLNREDFNNDKVDAGDIGSGRSVTAIYEITPANSKIQFIDDLRYLKEQDSNIDKTGFNNEYAFLKIRYTLPNEDISVLMTTPISKENEYDRLNMAPDDFRFAASVAAFGQILQGGIYSSNFSYDDVVTLAKSAISKDDYGYRNEFINMVRLAKSIK